MLGGPRQCGIRSLPDTSTHGQPWESNERPSDLESNALTTGPHAGPLCYVCNTLPINSLTNKIHAFIYMYLHSTEKPVIIMITYPWKCTVLHCNHLGNTWKPLVLMTRHFDYCPSASEGDNQSVGSSTPVVSRCFPGGYNVKLYISRGRLAWWLLAFLHIVDSRIC